MWKSRKLQVLVVYTDPKPRQISESTGEEVPWMGNFPVIRGTDV
jgi:hypothetical protein